MLMQLIGANYAGRKGRGRFGRYVMQMRLTCVQHSWVTNYGPNENTERKMYTHLSMKIKIKLKLIN